MNRFNWTYLADNGKKHHVGIMHGAQSGHLLVYCDARILLIDFNVLEDKTYSFFIDEQLCEISVEKKGTQFYYGFEINKTADTPRNRLRKKIEKKHLTQGMLLLGGLILLTIIVAFGLIRWNGYSSDNLLALLENNGQEGKARIMKVSPSEVTYFYIVNGQSYSSGMDMEDGSVVVLENGMPLEEGDEFVVTYVPNRPELNEIDYNRPTVQQIDRYRARAALRHRNLNPQVDSVLTNCLIDIAYDLKGIKGLADFYFQDAAPEDNPRNNRNTYFRMVRDLPFQNKKQERCWN